MKTRITRKTYCGEHGKDEAWPCSYIPTLDKLTVALNYRGILCSMCDSLSCIFLGCDHRKNDEECYACHGTGVKVPAHLDAILEQAFLENKLLQDNEKDVPIK